MPATKPSHRQTKRATIPATFFRSRLSVRPSQSINLTHRQTKKATIPSTFSRSRLSVRPSQAITPRLSRYKKQHNNLVRAFNRLADKLAKICKDSCADGFEKQLSDAFSNITLVPAEALGDAKAYILLACEVQNVDAKLQDALKRIKPLRNRIAKYNRYLFVFNQYVTIRGTSAEKTACEGFYKKACKEIAEMHIRLEAMPAHYSWLAWALDSKNCRIVHNPRLQAVIYAAIEELKASNYVVAGFEKALKVTRTEYNLPDYPVVGEVSMNVTQVSTELPECELSEILTPADLSLMEPTLLGDEFSEMHQTRLDGDVSELEQARQDLSGLDLRDVSTMNQTLLESDVSMTEQARIDFSKLNLGDDVSVMEQTLLSADEFSEMDQAFVDENEVQANHLGWSPF